MKYIAVLICTLLIAVAFAPVITASVKINSTIDAEEDALTLTKQDLVLLDELLEDLWIKFYEAENIKEKIEVIKEIIMRMDTYGLLPDGTSVKEAQKLVIDAFLFAEKLATKSQGTSLLNNDDIQVYIWAGMQPHPDDPTEPSFGSVLNCGLTNYRSDPVEWFDSQDYYDISSRKKNWHWPTYGWSYRGSVEPNDYDMTFSGLIQAQSELIKANVMVEDIIFSRWGVYLGFGLHYFPRIGGGGNSVPFTYGSPRESVLMDKDYTSLYFYKNLFPEYFTEEHVFQFNNLDFGSKVLTNFEVTVENPMVEKQNEELIQTTASDTPWPMYCHDNLHTGRSSYVSSHNHGFEKWRHKIVGMVIMSPSIDKDGTIYLAGSCLYAIHPNGTIKWKFDPPGGIFDFTCPAIDENGTIYAGTLSDKYTYMYAINPDGTVKWKKSIGYTYSTPTIGNNGMIYFAQTVSDKSYITALNTDGTIEWNSYTSEEPMYSSPAIGMDGTIYCGSHDYHLYAFNSDGTLKWKFNTGGRVHGSPTIGSDGTVFIGSENGLHALYPNNGSMKWHRNMGAVWGAPALDEDGTLYLGDGDGRFYAINPDGTIKWTYNAPGRVWFTSFALSADGIIYFSTLRLSGGIGKVIALNSDGTERWTWADSYYDYENFQSAPAIGEDGTVYIASSYWRSGGPFYLHAFGVLDPNAPNAPTINGQTNGKPWKEYEYTFKAVDPNGDDLYYYIDWGDGSEEAWIGPYSSGEEVKVSHIWIGPILYTIRAKAKNTDDLFGPWSTLEISMPMNQQSSNFLFLRFLERHPRMFPILRQLLGWYVG